jgi:predicted DNA-binding transcriptional regulator AlpA
MRLLNEHEVQEQFGLRVGTLRQWRFKGQGPRYLKIGRSCRYTAEDVLAFLQSHYRRSTSDPGSAGEGERNAGE